MSAHARCRPLRPVRAPRLEGEVPVYAFGLCNDQQYLVPGLTGLADSLTPAARREAAVQVLTLDLAPAQALLLADPAKRVATSADVLLAPSSITITATRTRVCFPRRILRSPRLRPDSPRVHAPLATCRMVLIGWGIFRGLPPRPLTQRARKRPRTGRPEPSRPLHEEKTQVKAMCLVPPAGFEPATPALGERCSIP